MVLHSCVERDHIVYQIKVDGKLVYVTGEDADLVMNMLCGVILIVHLAQIKDPPHLCDIDHCLCVYPYPVMNILLFGIILIVHLAQIKDPPHLCDIDHCLCVYP